MPLDAQRSQALRAGQAGWVKLDSYDEPISRHLYRKVRKWLRSRLYSTVIN